MIDIFDRVMAPAISATGFSLSYGQKTIFHDLQVSFPAGKCSVILGASGVGKSSLLHAIANLNGTSDNMQINPFSASDQASLSQRVAYMTQQDTLLPWLSVLDNVLVGARLRSTSVTQDDRSRAQDILQQLGLTDVLAEKPNVLSGGMRQRVALARVLFENRTVVLMDEPFAALDAITKWRLQALTVKMLSNTTRILVTHDPQEALRLGDYIFILAGRPAILSEPLCLTTRPPRDIDEPELVRQHAAILAKLLQAQDISYA